MAVASIGRIIGSLAEQQPDQPAITCEKQTVTWLELEKRTNRLARAYQQLGVKQDDLVTIALPNGIEFYESAIAVWKLGATPHPISARLPQLERETLVDLADAKLVVGVAPGSLGARVTLPPGFDPDPSLSDTPLPDRTARYWKASCSGGSTGRPKIIVSKEQGAFDMEAEEEFAQILPRRVHLVPGPLYHNAPFLFSMFALFMGNHLVVLERFDAVHTLECIERYRVDYVVLVPTMMHRIWRLDANMRERHDLSSLRIVLHMAAPCPRWLKQLWLDWLGPERIHELYGGTEAQSATWITGTEWLAHTGSVGKAMLGQVKVVDENGDELPPGAVGEIYLMPEAGPGTTYHYIGAEPRSMDGWESLGDMGWMDADGYLYLADRKSDMILRGGANIYPAEVEAAIDSHPKVRSSVVIGVPDEDLGQRVHAIVDAPEGVTDNELLLHLSERIARYKIPESFEHVSEPLRDDAGKVRRPQL
ncbi:MAG: AMP-binding protein, partial [Burkholderiales bacterium]